MLTTNESNRQSANYWEVQIIFCPCTVDIKFYLYCIIYYYTSDPQKRIYCHFNHVLVGNICCLVRWWFGMFYKAVHPPVELWNHHLTNLVAVTTATEISTPNSVRTECIDNQWDVKGYSNPTKSVRWWFHSSTGGCFLEHAKQPSN